MYTSELIEELFELIKCQRGIITQLQKELEGIHPITQEEREMIKEADIRYIQLQTEEEPIDYSDIEREEAEWEEEVPDDLKWENYPEEAIDDYITSEIANYITWEDFM